LDAKKPAAHAKPHPLVQLNRPPGDAQGTQVESAVGVQAEGWNPGGQRKAEHAAHVVPFIQKCALHSKLHPSV
jgi:hypothetical protein